MKLISVNIAGHKFIDRVTSFLVSSAADVICLQEVFEEDFNALKEKLGMSGEFAAMTLIPKTIKKFGDVGILGIGVLTGLRVNEIKKSYYYETNEIVPMKVNNQEGIHRVML